MEHFYQNAGDLRKTSLEGFYRIHQNMVQLRENPCYLCRKTQKDPSRIALISGGGSGHEPLHIGMIGRGMLDAACTGEVFTSPTPDQIVGALSDLNPQNGTLLIVKNFAGDLMNFEMALEMANQKCRILIVSDDVAIDNKSQRRGLSGTVIVEKIVGALAEKSDDLNACWEIGDRVVRNTGTIGVALSGCTFPGHNRTTFHLQPNEIEYGVGIHGEQGVERLRDLTIDELIHKMTDNIITEISLKPGEEVLLLVNGMGSTSLIELQSIYSLADDFCRESGLKTIRSLIGNFATALDMKGASISISRMDPELLQLWDAPVETPTLRW